MSIITPEALGSSENRDKLAKLHEDREQFRQNAHARVVGAGALHAANVEHLPLVATNRDTEAPRIEIPIDATPEVAEQIVVMRNTPAQH